MSISVWCDLKTTSVRKFYSPLYNSSLTMSITFFLLFPSEVLKGFYFHLFLQFTQIILYLFLRKDSQLSYSGVPIFDLKG